MKRKIGTIFFVGLLGISLLAGYHQYKSQESVKEGYDTSKSYYEDYDDSGLETYIISGVYNEVDEYIKDVRESGYCEYAYENEDELIEVKMTKEQRQGWIKQAVANIEEVLEGITEEDMYEFHFSEDYVELYSKMHEDCNGYEYTEELILLLYNAEIYQILNGTSDWSIHVVVENMKTGEELVNVQYPKERINITPEMWD